MKKKEIAEIIKAKMIIKNSRLLPLYSYCSHEAEYLKTLKELIEENEELKKQYERDVQAEQKFHSFQSSCTCNHQIRKKVYVEEYEDLFSQNYFYECIFCGHSIPTDKSRAGWFSEHYYNDCVYLENNSFNQFDLVINLLCHKNDEDEINFVEEFKKINLDSTVCTINDEKRPENYIMIIDDSLNFQQKTPINELVLLDSIAKINGIRVQLLSNCISYNKIRYGLFSSSGYSYPKDLIINDRNGWIDTIERDKKEHIPFKIIINLSTNLTYYDRELQKEIPINIALQNMFPKSIIINLNELNQKVIQELSEYIESSINNTSTNNLQCKNIKKLTRRHNE